MDNSASRDHAEGLDASTTANRCSHTNEGVVFESAGIKLGIWSDIDVLANSDLVAIVGSVASDPGAVLDGSVLANAHSSGVAAHDDAVPEGGTLSETNVTDDSSVWGDPVSLQID